MPPTIHARLSASSAHRWMNCPGSVRMSAGLKDAETVYQIEGRAAHALAEYALKHQDGWSHVAHVDVPTEDGPRAFPVDDTMRDAVELYVSTVQDLLKQVGGALYIERTFDLSILRPPEPMFGTADAVIVGDRTIDVIDLKYGAGVTVEVTDNVQLLYYALGAIVAEFTRRVMDPSDAVAIEQGENMLDAATRLFDRVRVHIVQPRAPHTDGPVRSSLIFSGADIKAFAVKLLTRADNVQAPDAVLQAGSWCQFCPARGHCPELAAHAKLVAQTDFESVPMEAPPDVEHMSIERVAAILQNVEVLNIFIDSLKQRITNELESGREVPGWKLVNKQAQRQWLGTEIVEEWAAGNGLTLDDIYEKSLRSPAQLEKIIGKAALPEDGLYARVSNGVALVPSTDPRPAAAVGPAADFPMLSSGDDNDQTQSN